MDVEGVKSLSIVDYVLTWKEEKRALEGDKLTLLSPPLRRQPIVLDPNDNYTFIQKKRKRV
ncbi:unnamed protein product [Cuscuta europaea]|uniref:Uncharacterized protein n=1 Tax=Cuscuta europaea TaxID=41803 RepID=A0A9P1EG13_CUSEU|nr:unnamed protein product [Cuscuta europaea]